MSRLGGTIADISIPEREVSFTFARSGGHGGQNVNKVSTKVILEFNVRASYTLTDDQKRIVLERSRYRTADGHLILSCDETRSQARNRELALSRLNHHLSELLAPVKVRKPTKPTFASKVRRAESKKKRSRLKSQRKLRYEL